MVKLGIEQSDSILDQTRTNAELIAETFVEAFGVSLSLEVSDASILGWRAWPDSWKHPGLIVALPIEDQAAIVLLPDPEAALPVWCERPDPSQQLALEALTASLASLILPPNFRSLEAIAFHVVNVTEALEKGSGDTLSVIPITFKSDLGTIHGSIILPVGAWVNLIPEPLDPEAARAGYDPNAALRADFDEPSDFADPHHRLEHDLPKLPHYVRSLLRVPVTVSVTLASTRTSLSKVVDIGPGTIIQFDKSCEAPLSLEVGEIEIANGEAVKIGDKFGLRVGEIVLPPERFHRVTSKRRRIG